jgi:penicillin-binding protein 1A
MATAYASIASGGYRLRPTAIKKITFPDGRVETGRDLPARFRVKKVRIFEDGVTAEATQILEQNIQGGTGTHANIGCPAAGKTGTTDNNTDAWFVGFTPRHVTSVWVGYPKDDIQMNGLYFGRNVDGGTFPADIWGDYMKRIKGSYCGDFTPPKTPFSAAPFFGKYSKSGGGLMEGGDESDTTTDPTVPTTPDTGTGGAEAPDDANGGETPEQNGQGGFDPDQYESPPQGEPETQAPPADGDGGATAPPP